MLWSEPFFPRHYPQAAMTEMELNATLSIEKRSRVKKERILKTGFKRNCALCYYHFSSEKASFDEIK